MEELSVEEKAQRYDLAIKRAKEINAEHSKKGFKPSDDVMYCFPELVESEDERIKEDIIWCLKHSGIKPDKPINPHVRTTMKEALAWLEKQGEQKPTHTDFSDLRTWKYIVDTVLTEKEGIGQYLDSQFTEEVAKKLQKRFCNIQQKPTWSEEDKKMFDSIINVLEVTPSASFIPIKRETMIPWLKSLKERVKPKQKQELNEDTQQWIDAITKDYEEWYKVNKDHSATIQIKINILKSLKERYTWKPSDKQINE